MAMEFNPSGTSNESIQWPNNLSIVQGGSTATFCCWIDTRDDTGSGRIFVTSIDGGSGQGSTRLGITHESNGTIGGFARDSTNNLEIGYSTGTVTEDVWTHIAVIVDIANDEMHFYIDGEFDSTDTSPTWSGTTFGTGTNANTAIASEENDGTPRYKGQLDDLRVYNRALSADEIKTIFTARGSDRIIEGLTFRVPFREDTEGESASGRTVYDVSPNKYESDSVSGTPIWKNSNLNMRY